MISPRRMLQFASRSTVFVATCFCYVMMSRVLMVVLDGSYEDVALKAWFVVGVAAVLFL